MRGVSVNLRPVVRACGLSSSPDLSLCVLGKVTFPVSVLAPAFGQLWNRLAGVPKLSGDRLRPKGST